MLMRGKERRRGRQTGTVHVDEGKERDGEVDKGVRYMLVRGTSETERWTKGYGTC